MYLKKISIALICSLIISAQLPAQQYLDPCDETEDMAHIYSPYGVAYEDGFSTAQLVATVLLGTAAVVVVVAALWNTPCHNHGHSHGKSRNNQSNHRHKHHFSH